VYAVVHINQKLYKYIPKTKYYLGTNLMKLILSSDQSTVGKFLNTDDF